MSTENPNNNALLFQCPHCTKQMMVQPPYTEVSNTARVSVAAVAHEKPVKCECCGGASVLLIQFVQITWAVQPITTEQASTLEGTQIITPPPGMRLVH